MGSGQVRVGGCYKRLLCILITGRNLILNFCAHQPARIFMNKCVIHLGDDRNFGYNINWLAIPLMLFDRAGLGKHDRNLFRLTATTAGLDVSAGAGGIGLKRQQVVMIIMEK